MNSTDKARLSRILEPCFDPLYRAALRLTRNAADAEDLVQDVCLKAALRLQEFDAIGDHRAWLLRVQYRIFVDGVRRRQRSPLRAVGTGDDPAGDLACESPGPEAAVDAMASHRNLDRAWATLNREQRALLGYHAEGYDLGEISEITGLSKGALSARLYRARSRFARTLLCGGQGSLAVNKQEA